MSDKDKSVKKSPNLRFPGFEDEWEIGKLSKYIKLYRGSSPRPIVKYITTEDTGVNWIKIGDAKNSVNSIISEVDEKITFEGAKKSRKVEKGELILANSMSFGKTYQLGIDGYIYDGWFVLRKYDYFFRKPFLLQLLNSDYLQNQYRRLSAGGVVQNISSEIVNETILIRPNFDEQKKIEDFLTLLDEKIETQKKTITKNQSLMQFLGDSLISGKHSFDWNFPERNSKKIKDVLTIGNGKDYKHLSSGNVPVYGTGGIIEFVDSALFDGETVCIGRKGTINKPMYFQGKIWTVDTLFFTHSFVDCIPKYIFYLFQTINWLEYNEASGVPSLSKSTIEKISIELPSIEEQSKIVEILDALQMKIDNENKILELLEQQKKYFLQNLFI